MGIYREQRRNKTSTHGRYKNGHKKGYEYFDADLS